MRCGVLQRGRHRELAILCVLSFLVMGDLCCSKGCHGTQSNRESTQSSSQLGHELGLSFPPSTRVLGVRRESGIDDAVLAKIEISKNEFQAFFAKTPIDPAAMRPGTGGFLGSDVDFWDPHKAPALKTGQGKSAAGRVLSIGVDESRPDIVVLYIMEFST
jgi:hypothetical protein